MKIFTVFVEKQCIMIYCSYVHTIPSSQVSMNDPLPVKILYTFGGLKCHFDDFLRGESSWRPFAT